MFFRKQKQNIQNFTNVGLNLSDYEFRQENKEKYKKKKKIDFSFKSSWATVQARRNTEHPKK